MSDFEPTAYPEPTVNRVRVSQPEPQPESTAIVTATVTINNTELLRVFTPQQLTRLLTPQQLVHIITGYGHTEVNIVNLFRFASKLQLTQLTK